MSARLLTVADVRRLLDEHGLAPRKAFGQNFVVDQNTLRKVVRDAAVGRGDVVLEVGAGLGSLTLALREAGARVLAVEIDAGLVRALSGLVGEDPDVRLVHGDALRADLGALVRDALAAWGLKRERVLLVANLPYSTATPLLFRALQAEVVDGGLVMVQRDVGRRWVAAVGDPLYGAVSVKVAALADAAVAAAVARTAFFPVPNVDSVTVRLRALPWRFPVPRGALFALVDAGFAQRRKRLRNALAQPGRAPTTVEAALSAAGLDPFARAEEVALEDWVTVAAALLDR